MAIVYRDILPSDGQDLSSNFVSFINELKENPSLGLGLRKQKPTPSEELHWFADYFEDVEKGSIISTVAVDDEKGVVGLCDVECRYPGSYVSHKAELGIAILKEFRGMGIGTELLRRTIEKCRGRFDVIELRVFSTSRAKRLYERFGFKPYGHDPYAVLRDGKYYEDDLMYLKLS